MKGYSTKTKVPKWKVFDNKEVNRWRKEGAAASKIGGGRKLKKLTWKY